jgi:hypothetical protein
MRRLRQVGEVWHLIDLPEGYHTPARGQSQTNAGTDSIEGCPRAGVWSGCARSTGCHTAPARKIDLWAVTGPSDVEK